VKPAKALTCFALLIAAVHGAWAQGGSVDVEVVAGLEAERRMDPLAALAHFRAAAARQPDDAFLQQKIAQQLSDAAFIEHSATEHSRLINEALVHAQRAVELDPDSAVARLSVAVLYGKLAINADTRTRVNYARRVYAGAEEALKLDPEYAWAMHVLGRWNVEMSQLNLAKRAVVSLFFGGLPHASLDEGIKLLEKAVHLEGDSVAHRVELGFAYDLAGRRADARACWEAAIDLPSSRIFDAAAKKRAVAALSKTDPEHAAYSGSANAT
jgi:tetratricopeptide (TPR) repeat protein